MTQWKPQRHATHPLPCRRPVMLHTPRHAARSRSIQKTTAERFKPKVAGFRDWRAE